jgi:glycosyltransferase involved in cell wall biosynthesis
VPLNLNATLDSIYFFMWPGWRTELEANRWHWGKRWAERLPTVFIQPELPCGTRWQTAPEPRLANVELLSIEASSMVSDEWLGVAVRQAGQIVAHMSLRGYERPLFWFYNPQLAGPFALIPSRARVLHGTENYFDFEGVGKDLLNLWCYAAESSDLVICCSSGVVSGLKKNTQIRDVLLLPNGCDFRKYSRPSNVKGGWSARLNDWRSMGRRLAVFAGNINERLDFELIETLAARYTDIGFVFAGPVDTTHLSDAQRCSWRNVELATNVRILGRLPVEDLPALYWSCDVGIIPYRTDLPKVVENGFPLKALEMAAAGLPVVASLMKPLKEAAGAVTVVADAAAFSAAILTHSRRSRSQEQRALAERICRASDYDLLFDRMLQSLGPRIDEVQSRPASLEHFVNRIGLVRYRLALQQLAAPPSAPQRLRDLTRYRVGALLGLVPARLRRMAPQPIKRLARRWLS